MLRSSLGQAWPPFVLVAALLAIGVVAHRDGLFAWAGERLDRLPGPPVVLFAACCALLALVTAVLNLDTAVVFVTPVTVHAARRRGLDVEPFAYASLFMANASSLYLPGSNLTNLLVLDAHPEHAGSFAPGFLAPALAATVVTAGGLWLIFRRRFAASLRPHSQPAPARLLGPGLLGAGAAAALTIAFRNPALPVLAAAAVIVAAELVRSRITPAQLVSAISPHVLAGVFAVAVALGVLARAWHGPAQLLASASRPATAAIAAGASVLVNNLPAAVMLSAGRLPHPRALLIGLNLGPNLAVTGSLAAYLWMAAARQVQAPTSWLALTRRGLLLAPASIAVALLVSTH